MWEKCLDCDLHFATHHKMKNHYSNVHLKKFECPICPKTFQNIEEREHHLNLEHQGMSQIKLNEGSKALQTKKQLGVTIGKKGTPDLFECPDCFEIFSNVKKLDAHRKTNHNMEFTDEAKSKLKELQKSNRKTSPKCDVCTKIFLGIIICKINGETVGACLTCYENHYGPNALTRLTIGTPEEMIEKMKIPLV